jgi:hypothetical protein
MRNLILFLAMTVFLATGAAARVYVVEPGGPLTIQAAINLCFDGDVVELLDGVYRGNGNRDLVLDGKEITVRSASGDPTSCIIDPEGSDAEYHRGFTLDNYENLNTVIEGITITGGQHAWSGGIFCEVATIRNCHFIGNQGSEGGGITMQGSGVIEDCLFVGNHASSGGGVSVCCAMGATAQVTRCTFFDNTAVMYGGGFRA